MLSQRKVKELRTKQRTLTDWARTLRFGLGEIPPDARESAYCIAQYLIGAGQEMDRLILRLSAEEE